MRPFTAVFDSGVGGLTVLRALTRRCPGERFGYFGDNANAPYGSRAPEEIEELVFAAFGRLSRMPLKAAVVACNTATALCIDRLRASFPFPVVGVEPAVRPAARLGGRALLLATRATLASARVKALLARTGGRSMCSAPKNLRVRSSGIFSISPRQGSRRALQGSRAACTMPAYSAVRTMFLWRNAFPQPLDAPFLTEMQGRLTTLQRF